MSEHKIKHLNKMKGLLREALSGSVGNSINCSCGEIRRAGLIGQNIVIIGLVESSLLVPIETRVSFGLAHLIDSDGDLWVAAFSNELLHLGFLVEGTLVLVRGWAQEHGENAERVVMWAEAIQPYDGSSLDSDGNEIYRLESPLEMMFWEATKRHTAALIPQYEIVPYRVDFAVPEIALAIEIDGHEFHKDREQRTRDAKRDRYLQRKGWTVMRFTGSEIYRDVEECVNEVLALLPDKFRQ